MFKRIVSGIMQTLLLAVMLSGTFPMATIAQISPNTARMHQTNSVYVRETGSEVYLGNDFLEIGFVKNSGSLWSILHKESGIDLRTRKDDPNEGLWDIWLTLPDLQTKLGPASPGRSIQFYTGYDIQNASGNCTITLRWSKIVIENYGIYALSIIASISVFSNSSLTNWTISCENTGEAFLEAIHFPFIIGVTKLGAFGSDDFLVYPNSEGRIFSNPSENLQSLGGDYPSRGLNMQFMAYYDSMSGFYIAANDNRGFTKHFWFACDSQSMGVLHWPGINFTQRDWQLPYKVILGTFSGDWLTAASIYKDWASKQWWATPRSGANSIPRWLKEVSIGWMDTVYSQFDSFHNQTYDELVERLKSHQEFFKMPVSPNIEGWCKYGVFAWGDILPPKLGWSAFDQMLYQVHKLGSRMRLSVNPFNLDISTPLWKSNQYLDCCARDQNGEICMFYGIEPAHAQMCIGTSNWREKIKQDILALARHGVDMILFDGFPTGILGCYDRGHNHTLGCGGNWWAKTWIDFLHEIRQECRAINPDIVFGGEDLAEIFLPFLDAYDNVEVIEEVHQWACSGGAVSEFHWKHIPLFRYVYDSQSVFLTFNSEPISVVGEEDIIEDLRRFNILCVARALTRGETLIYGYGCPHHIGDPEWDGAGFEFARKCAQARATYAHNFLVEGCKTKDPPTASPMLTIDWRHKITFNEPAIQSSAWTTSSGNLGFVFTNIWNQTISFTLSFDLSDYGIAGSRFAYSVRDGTFTSIGQVSSLFNSTFEIKPCEVLLIALVSEAKPDLFASGDWLPHPSIDLRVNATSLLNLTLWNIGPVESGAFNVSFIMRWNDGNLTEHTEHRRIENLGPGDNTTIVFDFKPTKNGEYLFSFYSDAAEEVSELDELNNFLELELRSITANVALVDVFPRKSIISQGSELGIDVTVKNSFAQICNVTLYFNSQEIATESFNLTSVFSVIAFWWNTSEIPLGTYTVSAYAWPVLGETDTADNNYTDGTVKVGVPGDLNGDNLCDLLDLVRVAGKFGKVLGEPGYDPNYDFNDDNIIDLLDLVKVAMHFGETDS